MKTKTFFTIALTETSKYLVVTFSFNKKATEKQLMLQDIK